MTVRTRLVTGFFMVAALFAIQANAQVPPGQNAQTAYQTLQTALQNNASGSEVVDEAAVQAARNAGLSDAQIAGAMQESGRSVDQQVAALLPSNPTAQQANAAANAVSNATNAAGVRVAAATTNSAQINTALQNAGVPATVANNAATQVTSTQSAGNAIISNALGGGVTYGSYQDRLFNLSATAAGSAPPPALTRAPNTNVTFSSGPTINFAARIVRQPVVVVPRTPTPPDAPTIPVIPEPNPSIPLHIF